MVSYDVRKILKRLKQEGYEISTIRGKGSHYMAFKEGVPPFPIPTSKKDIPIGTVRNIEKITGLKF